MDLCLSFVKFLWDKRRTPKSGRSGGGGFFDMKPELSLEMKCLRKHSQDQTVPCGSFCPSCGLQACL